MSRYPSGAMSDVVHGQDAEPDPPTLDEPRRAHDWRTEKRADGCYIVDICQQCGYEEAAGSRGPAPDCDVREVPSNAREYARRRGLIPESIGAREDSLAGVPGESA